MLNDVCSDESFTSDAAMVERVRAWQSASVMVRIHTRWACGTMTNQLSLRLSQWAHLRVFVCVCVCVQRAEDVAVDPRPIVHPRIPVATCLADAIDCS